MKKVEHVGTVVAVEKDTALVELKPDPACAGSFSCSCCSLKPAEPRRVRVWKGDLEEGDTVYVGIPAYAGYLSTFVVFILPLVLFVTGLLVGARWESGGAHGLPTLVGAAIGFGTAVLIALAVNRWLADARRFSVRRVKQEQQQP